MISLVVSDLHAHAWTRFGTTLPDGTNSRFMDLLNVLDQVGAYADRYQPESLLVLGDVTHRRYFVSFAVYNRLMAKLDWLLDRVTGNGAMMVGNHDFEARGVHSLAPFAYAGWQVIDAPTWRPEGLFVPWLPDDAVSRAVLEPPRPTAGRVDDNVFLHYALDGHVLDSEFALPSPLRLDHLDAFRSVVLGHVHRPAVEQEGLVTYVGAPLHFDFGDVGDRFCWLMDTDRGTLTPLPLRAPRFCTTAYPKVPVKGFEEAGYLRVLHVPAREFEAVKQQALTTGWADCMPVEAAVPSEAVRALTSDVLVDADVMRAYVDRQFPDLDEAARRDILGFGLAYLSGEIPSTETA